jgi:MoxR-like ATPase
MAEQFHIIGSERAPADSLADFQAQKLPKTLSNLQESARYFQPDEGLILAINSALAVGVPLLLTGEPGTGKTSVAYWVAERLGLLGTDRFLRLSVQSTTTAEALLYQFDNVAYFHKAYEQKLGTASGDPIDKWEFVRKGVLWRALEAPGRAVVLIDEIDKAPREFPNDLLHALDQYEIEVQELSETHPRRRFARTEGQPPPLVVITSNSERRLPEPFLRRCVFHPMALDPEIVTKAVERRRQEAGEYRDLSDETRSAAIQHFFKLRRRELRKKPSTAELLLWLTILSARRVDAAALAESVPARELPSLNALIKDQDDLASIHER